MPLLQLIRWKNLLIIFCTQLLVWLCVILPAEPGVLTPVNFMCLALSTVLIAAAGYIINDYFDNKIDAINKPGKVVLGKAIPRKQAIIYHSVLNGMALVLAAIVARSAGHYEWLSIQIACTLLLWFYSTKFKRQLVIGNVVVALLTSLTIITLIIYEPQLHYFFLGRVFEQTANGTDLLNPAWLLIFYTAFAFLLTCMREIVKDMEDMKGDAEEGCITIPIKWGLLSAARVAQCIGAITLLTLIASGVRLLNSNQAIMGWYLLLIVAPLLLIWIVQLNRKYTIAHYNRASNRLKIIMVLGLCSLIVSMLSSHFTF